MNQLLQQIIQLVSIWAIPVLIFTIISIAAFRKVKVYEEFVEGAKEGFQTGVKIIPYLVAMLVAIGMFRAAGGIDWISRLLQPILSYIGMPSEILPLALMRPMSGSASMGIFGELVKTHGADSLIARMAGTILGSTETTFYVLSVYFGSVAVTRPRHALLAGLMADATGIMVSIWVCRWMFGGG